MIVVNQRLAILLDILAVTLAIALGFVGRIAANPLFDYQFHWPGITQYFPPVPLVVAVWIFFYVHSQHYAGDRLEALDKLIIETCKADVMVFLIVVGIAFFGKDAGEMARSVLIFVVAFNGACRPLLRWVVGIGLHRFLKPENVLIVGALPDTATVARELFAERNGTRLTGLVQATGSGARTENGAPLPHLGEVQDLGTIINEREVDRVVIDEGRISASDFLASLRSCSELGVPVEVLPQLPTLVLGETEPIFRNGRMLYRIQPQEARRPAYLLKWVTEWCVAVPLALAALPLGLIIAVLIKLDSPGPILYRQKRVGKRCRHFTLYKFRTMVENSNELREQYAALNEKSGAMFKIKADPRITGVGRWLRRFSLDELPQLLNFFKGEMGLVGPRPLPVEDVEPLQDGPHHEWIKVRANVPPGITGYWQVNGRSRLEFEDMIEFDLFYVRNWSLRLDLQILLKTPYAVIKAEGAY